MKDCAAIEDVFVLGRSQLTFFWMRIRELLFLRELQDPPSTCSLYKLIDQNLKLDT